MKIGLIITREFLSKIRNKSFIIMTFLSPMIMIAIVAIVAILSQEQQEKQKVAVYDASQKIGSQLQSTDAIQFEDITSMGLAVAKEIIPQSGYVGLLHISAKNDSYSVQLLSQETPTLDFVHTIEKQIESVLTNERLLLMGMHPSAIEKAKAKVTLELYNLNGESDVRGLNEIKMVIGGAFGYLIMMFIVIYGNFVMRSVIEEKTNRVIEVIVSSVKPIQLMLGKIIGTSLAGIMQFIIWVLIGLSLLLALSLFMEIPLTNPAPVSTPISRNMDLDIAAVVTHLFELPILSILSAFVVYFIGGYLLYSSMYAAIGAAVDSETDSQQFLLPVISPLIIGVYVGLVTVVSDPHGMVATVFSYIPFTSPIVMMMRIPFGVPWWEVALSLCLLCCTFMLIVWFASRVYKVGILMYGKKPTYRELFKWIK